MKFFLELKSWANGTCTKEKKTKRLHGNNEKWSKLIPLHGLRSMQNLFTRIKFIWTGTPRGNCQFDSFGWQRFGFFPPSPHPLEKREKYFLFFGSLHKYWIVYTTHSCFIFSIRTFSPVIPCINTSSIRGVMLAFACSPTLILRRTSSTRRAVLWIWVESRTWKN